ncbi:T9SS type A sorting domain-containing protein [Flavobacteriaceae bacterium S356]|uniref:T9SS type A sorting domain-containing protein n=1 Tax=Asprobacillus argus TaxID=3076534 RepID=A0ABU3LD78_9FLAO|nr:T9SS type A sorting domain-containing protein [Flavobacteriaceae bacterium S356]
MKKTLLLFALLLTQISYSQTVTIPDANFKAALIADGVDTNNDGEIQVSEAEAITEIDVFNENISSLEGISSFINLKILRCVSNDLTTLDISGLSSLTTLDCDNNQLTSLNLTGLSNLTSLNVNNNELAALNITDLSDLSYLYCHSNELVSLNLNGLSNLINVYCDRNELTSLDLAGLINLNVLSCYQNKLTSLNLNGLSNITDLNCSNNQLTSLDLDGLSNITDLNCNNNLLTSLDLGSLSNLTRLDTGVNQLASIDLNGLSHLSVLGIGNNRISALQVNHLTNLTSLGCGGNDLTTLDVSNLSLLRFLSAGDSQLNTFIKPNGTNSLETLSLSRNNLTHLDLSNLVHLTELSCGYSQLTSLDLAYQSKLERLYLMGNELLETLFVKNGSREIYVNIHDCHNLTYICGDSEDIPNFQYYVDLLGFNCAINSFCTFIPGGEVFYAEGNVRLDLNNDGCDTNDVDYGTLQLKVTNADNESGTFSTNADGSYNIALPEGNYTIEYVLENPSYFNVSPASFTVDFSTDTSPHQQDFCLTANGVVQDLEIQVIPLELARPGFDAEYKIVYKNNGTSTVSGSVTLTYDDNVLDLVSSTPNFTASTPNFLSWDYANLTPSETREIFVTMNLNSPMETPPLNGGEILCYDAAITPTTNDQRVNDNTFTLKQTVVNSYDPNDKTCLEGNIVTPDLIGEYVHYLIRFENTGTASAVNVVVKDIIDTDKFDISTIFIYDSSHDMVTRIQNTNEVEFIFEGINLPFDDANNDGYIAFKIKTLPSLVVGDTFENNAEIYFDFNFPIITNTEQTTIDNTASVDDVFAASDIRIFPNPTNELLTIESSVHFDSVTIYDLKGRQLQMISSTLSQLTKQIDMTHLASGIYYVSVQSGTAKKLLKVIRE